MAILGTVLTGADPGDVSLCKVMLQQVINALAIRDTATYDPTTTANINVANMTFLGGYRMLFVNNGLNQDISVQLVGTILPAASDPILFGPSFLIKANKAQMVDSQDLPQLMDPIAYLSVQVIAQSSPASGTFSAWIAARSC